MDNLLEVKNLKTYFYTEDGVVPAVNGVDFTLKPGQTLGIVGESGCGKSITSMSIMRLIPTPPGKIIDGEIIFDNKDLLAISELEMRRIRGNDIAMIFQEPMTSLNPVYTIGSQIMEAVMLHQKLNKNKAQEKCIEMLELVGIPRAAEVVNDYPHQFSGGMRQRVMIAMALSCNPKLLIADEPTTALDVTIQAQILELMKGLKEKLNTATMLITHDLGVVAETADHVIVMYAGRVVEEANVMDIFEDPKHPYTIGLLNSKPSIDKKSQRLEVIQGSVPNPLAMPVGCAFHPRCSQVMDICTEKVPDLVHYTEERKVRCWLFHNSHGEESE
ncbi:oligopeptide/dipeptide ABC transporter, ATPase subunit [Alkaliphilus metalliredigens QYMF]|uniref:Oligopeptide/dipeptide ABC transporter, ATPase subunit n=1 Tax=Alkaliphilus metalliredigens (strain QYMF) TaxID=293826 RepID=A6TS94_ALKMQ|nr:ABC transporter ATP-binding protein [Alkaliphilus metalliredigens]ABR49062.1 oligopeptide/dipeptide ABC transporter, ATPase subunit [Alkaliphilus metalliredigens QYMF]